MFISSLFPFVFREEGVGHVVFVLSCDGDAAQDMGCLTEVQSVLHGVESVGKYIEY